MAIREIYKKPVIVSAVILFILFLTVSYGHTLDYDNWISYTSTNEVREIDFFDDSLQVVTSGGWLRIDPVTLGVKKLTNVDGLGTGDLYDILKDADGDIWLAGYGRLIKCRNSKFTPYLFLDRNDKLMPLYDIEDDGGMLWVGTSTGLALFSKTANGGQIEDFYFRFGGLNPEPAVFDIKIVGDSIWLATSAGLAVADKKDPDLLKSFINWTSFVSSRFPELAGDTVSALAYFENSIFLGTNQNSYRLDFYGDDTSFVKIPTREPAAVSSMKVTGDSLVIYTRNGFYIHTGVGTVWSNTPSIPSVRFLSGRFVDAVHWLGLQRNGLYYGDNGDYSKFPDGGLPGNYVTVITSDNKGTIAGGFQTRGAALFDDNEWIQAGIVGTVENGVRQGVRALILDYAGNLWVGTWGNGVMLVTPDSIINYDENNSSLLGIAINPNYVVVNSMVSFSNYLFMTNYQAYDGRSVSVVNLEDKSEWRFFDRTDSLTSEFPVSIDYYDGTLVVGTQYTGVFTYYCGPDPFVETGAKAVNLREDNSNLGSNMVNVVRFDNHGVLWVGHKYGLSRYDEGIPRFDDIILPSGFGPDVTALIFDGRNNAWIGARNGLAFYNAATDEFTVYTTLNSGLPDNQVNALTINPATGDLWVGTPFGLSRFRSLIGPPTDDVTRVIAFPNPFLICSGAERLNFNYDGTATVRIFTPTGELVRTFAINIPWDGKNQSGRDVAAGVYLALITGESGEVGRCKIMLIRD